jgi:hypothetical protein
VLMSAPQAQAHAFGELAWSRGSARQLGWQGVRLLITDSPPLQQHFLPHTLALTPIILGKELCMTT